MQSHRHEGDSGDEHGIDLAPMLDFVLNLLIFFIITTSFVREPGITVNRQEAATASPRESGNILIALRANDEIWMDRRQVDLKEVRPLIERLHVERPEDTVIVIADKAAKAGLLARVMDEVALGGIEEIAIGAQSLGEG
ncbi:MAG: biopolymer transporter ExbD [Myxococcota bacterium]